MLDHINLKKILFLDIETVPAYPDFISMPEALQQLWTKKAERLSGRAEEAPAIYHRAGIYAEFGKIVCICTGNVVRDEEGNWLQLRTFSSEDEPELLKNFASFLNEEWSREDQLLCAHNGKEFDFPFLARRFLVNNIRLPAILKIAGKKPWQVQHLDTLELWKFGDYKTYTSLDLLAAIFNLPTPKSMMDGSQVYQAYWQNRDLKAIREYCSRDVITIVRLFLKYQGKPEVEDHFITFVP